MEEKNRELELKGKKIEDEVAGGAAGGLGNIIETKNPDWLVNEEPDRHIYAGSDRNRLPDIILDPVKGNEDSPDTPITWQPMNQ